MSDALASHAVAQEAAVLRCHCLAHGRRKVSDLVEVFPHACQVVLEVISAVCDHDEQARLASPQAPRPPLMDGRKRWLARQMADHLVEPNRALGKAMVDRQKPWATWTQFFSVPGAPLDHNLAERALKLFLRQRNHSLFSQHEPSASMASILTSLSAPCLYAGVKAVESLVALQEPRGEVGAAPAAWLPGAYASSRASPYTTRRQSWAIWARAGLPCHSTRRSSRADRGTRASGRWGPQGQWPCESLCKQNQEPWPSERKSLSAVPVRLRKT